MKQITCPDCNGTGYAINPPMQADGWHGGYCPRCDGSGLVLTSALTDEEWRQKREKITAQFRTTCPDCDGAGYHALSDRDEACARCDGWRVVLVREESR